MTKHFLNLGLKPKNLQLKQTTKSQAYLFRVGSFAKNCVNLQPFIWACEHLFGFRAQYHLQNELNLAEKSIQHLESQDCPSKTIIVVAIAQNFGKDLPGGWEEEARGNECRAKEIQKLLDKGYLVLETCSSDCAAEIENVKQLDATRTLYFRSQISKEEIGFSPVVPGPWIGIKVKRVLTERDLVVRFVGTDWRAGFSPEVTQEHHWSLGRDLSMFQRVAALAGWVFDYVPNPYQIPLGRYYELLGEAAVSLCPRSWGCITNRPYEVAQVGGLPLIQTPESRLPVPLGELEPLSIKAPMYFNEFELYDWLVRLKDPELRAQLREQAYISAQRCYDPQVLQSYYEDKIRAWLSYYHPSLLG